MISYFQKCKTVLRKFSIQMSDAFIFIILCLIKFYNFFISPLLGVKCRFLPSCSEYAKESLHLHGLLEGCALIVKRILRCHPIKFLGGGDGIDLVPKKKNKFKGLN